MNTTQQPTGTLGFVANMMGLGPLMAAVNDPQAHEFVRQLMAAILATNQRCERLEFKLDLLCRAWGLDTNDGQAVAEYIAAVPATGSADGAGGHAAAIVAHHDGGSPPPSGDGLGAALASYAAATGHDFDLEGWLKSQAGLDGGVPSG